MQKLRFTDSKKKVKKVQGRKHLSTHKWFYELNMLSECKVYDNNIAYIESHIPSNYTFTVVKTWRSIQFRI